MATILPNRIIGMLQIEEYYPDLVAGFFMSMGLYIFALFFGLGLGLVLAIARHYGGPIVSRLSTGYIEAFRGTPLLAQVFAITAVPYALNTWLLTQGLPPIDFSFEIVFPDLFGIPRVMVDVRILLCVLALGLNSAAYQAEFFRGALSSISAGQTLAAQSIGMSKRQEIRYIALPQSLRRAIPAWSNEAVYLPVYTSIAYMVGVQELLSAATLIVSFTFLPLQIYTMVAVIFLVLVSFISWLLNYTYQRVKIPGI